MRWRDHHGLYPQWDYEFSVPLAGGMIETYLAARFV